MTTRFIFADGALVDGATYNAANCRALCDAFRDRGHLPHVLAPATAGNDVAMEFEAQRLFRTAPQHADDDVVCGWLNTLQDVAEATLRDWRRVPPLGEADIVYAASVSPGELMGLAAWAAGLPTPPGIVAEISTPPPVTPRGRDEFLVVQDAAQTATQWRFATRRLRQRSLPRFHVVTYSARMASCYAPLLGLPVSILPMPWSAQAPAYRLPRHPPTVGIIGHQRMEKGYTLVPELVRLTLARFPDTHVLIHDSSPRRLLPNVDRELAEMAAANPRIVLDQRAADGAAWSALLQDLDLIVCPYRPDKYIFSASSIIGEAIAHALPAVMPADTSLSDAVAQCGGAGVAFTEWTAPAIAETIAQALSRLPDFIETAQHAATRWRSMHGAAQTAGTILFLLKAGAA